MSTDGQDAIA